MTRRINFLLLLLFNIIFLLSACSEKSQTGKHSTDENWLQVSGDQIVNQKGDTVYLRGFGLGGMLHMENFINGYPANEET
ncbi:MAG TPA: glycoside hydrolase family 5 protein, partial [Bacteroides sp.]|nr:glycoside hydrolase family 5 protein [Bacteroides sp.]